MGNNENTIILVSSNLVEYKKMIEKHKSIPYYKYAIIENLPQFEADSKVYYYFAKDNHTNNDIGFIVCYKPKDQSILWIQSLVIFESYSRQRNGTRIINYLCNLFKTNSQIKHIYLTCYKDNIKGLQFWTSLGFQDVTLNNREFIWNNKHDNIILFKKYIQGVPNE